MPLGVVTGRLVWRSFARELGVVSDPSTPLATVLVAVAGGMALAVLAAQVPAQLAARTSPAEGLRRG